MVSIAVYSLKNDLLLQNHRSCASFCGPIYSQLIIRIGCAGYAHPFVYFEDLKWSIQGYSFCLLANQLKVAAVAVRMLTCVPHLLRNNFSRNLSSIRSAPYTYV